MAIFRLIFPALLLLLLLQPLSAAEPRDAKRVLILYSEDEAHPAHEMTDQGIRAAFGSNKFFNVQLYTEYLDVSRFGEPSHARATADYLRGKYSGVEIHAIITVYPYALDFLLAERSTLFSEVPIIAAEITSRSYAENLERSPTRRFVTGTLIGDDITGLMDVALRLRPETRHVALVAGTAPNDAFSEEIFRSGLRPYAGRIDLIDLTKLSMEETLSRLRSLPSEALVLYSTIFKDGAGKAFVPREALLLISRAAAVPVFALYESYLGFGIVGGRMVSFHAQGKEAAGLALRIMRGEPPADITIGGDQGYVSAYDWRELKRWNISEADLPAGSQIRYRTPSFWEEYRGAILAGISFIIIETLLVISLFMSLHKRRRAESEIAATTLRYRTVADYTYDWEYWLAPDGTLNYVSPSCERITGYSAREFMDDPSLFLGTIVPEDRETWGRHHRDAHNQLNPGGIQFRIRTKGGETRWIDHVCTPVTDTQGKFLGVRASNRDISDRKKAEFEAQQHRDELAHVTRVAAMGELTSSIAHELNQPLAAIRNYANAAKRFLSQGEPGLSKARDALEGIIRDDRRAAELISGVRGLLKKEESCYRPVHVNSVIQEMLVFIRGDSVLEGLSIETDFAPVLPAVLGERVQLQQVLLNLMLNAVDAMNQSKPDLRKLVIKTENDEDRGVKVSVRDFGAGIDETHKDKMFEPFYTTKPVGMGMGLAISQRIISAHGGSIWAENNPGGGATFYFTLPASTESSGPHGA